jgi:DNA transposition AAA+ family ATPase
MNHFLDLDGARPINTPGFALVKEAVPALAASLGIGSATGPAGTGKTFALESALASSELPVSVHKLEFQNKPTPREVARKLLNNVTGVENHGYRWQLTEQLEVVLAEEVRLIVVDEAQRLNRDCFEVLRYLHDHPKTRFGLIFSGGNGCWDVLSREPMLESRIWRPIFFETLSTAEVLKVVPLWHPLYESARREDLLLVDDVLTHGNFRKWAGFTKTAVEVAGERGEATLTEEIARLVFGLHGGGLNGA